MNTQLLNNLKQDIKDLIEAINNDELLQDISIDTTFETLGEFASYWEKHLDNIQRTDNNNLRIEYR